MMFFVANHSCLTQAATIPGMMLQATTFVFDVKT